MTRADLGGVTFDHIRRLFFEDGVESPLRIIQSLAQSSFGRNRGQIQTGGKKRIRAKRFDGFKIRFSQTQQSDHGFGDRSMRKLGMGMIGENDRVEPFIQLGFVQQCAD